MTLAVQNPPLKWPGGKRYLQKHIHTLASRVTYTHRVISYAGGLGEFWNWEYEGISEVVNDIDLALTNFYKVLQNPVLFFQLHTQLSATPFSKYEFDYAGTLGCEEGMRAWISGEELPSVDAAHAFFVRVRQSMMGMRKGFTPLTRSRTRCGMNAEVSAWFGAVDGLDQVHARLIRTVICNEDAVALIRREDGPATLHYLDPPYPIDNSQGEHVRIDGLYQHEMTYEQHCELLETLCDIEGKVILSTLPNDLYLNVLGHWNVLEVEIDNKMDTGSTKSKNKELLLYNF